MKLDNKINKSAIYISFYDASINKVVPEYIPTETTRFGLWFTNKLNDMYLRFGIQLNYWNLRHLLDYEMRKTEDLLFIIHVIEDHDGVAPTRRERKFYTKMNGLYGNEIEQLIKPYITEKKEQDPIVHPYYLAYKKRWIRPKDSQAKRFYHGMDRYELDVMFESLINRSKTESNNYKYKKAYYKRMFKK